MDPIDTWRAADQMLKLYGDDAAIKAALRGDALLDQGGVDGFHAWKRLVVAITNCSATNLWPENRSTESDLIEQ
jgi:hypothetical protein